MAYARIQHAGGAVTTTLNGAITSGATSATLLASTGWPDGTTGPFYAVIDANLATEEKILITSRTSLTLNTITRGVDGTSAAAHASGATISHCFTAVEADEANVAVNKTIGQVTTKGDLLAATANQTLGRLAAGANNTLLHADSGATPGLSYSKIVAADITAATITATELASNSVTTAKITDANVTLAKLAAGLQPVQVVTSGTRPGSPTAGMTIFETDTLRYYGYSGSAWVFIESLATGEDRVSVSSAATHTASTVGGAGVTLATLNISAKPFAYTLVASAFWSANFNDIADYFDFTIKVDGVTKAAGTEGAGRTNDRVIFNLPTSTPVVIAANTATAVTVVAVRSSGANTLTEVSPGVVTAMCYRLNP